MNKDTLKELKDSKYEKAYSFVEFLTITKDIPLSQININDFNVNPPRIWITIPYVQKGGGLSKSYKRFSDSEKMSAGKFYDNPLKFNRGSKIKSHIYAKGKSPDFQKLSKEQLNADYPFKNAEWVWDNWTKEQRKHFVLDHSVEIGGAPLELVGETNYVYAGISKDIQNALISHIESGRYAQGNKVSGEKNYESQLHNLRDDKVFRIKIKEHGVEIKEYEVGDAYTHELTITKAELLSMLMESFLKQDATEEDLVEVISGYTKYLLQNKK